MSRPTVRRDDAPVRARVPEAGDAHRDDEDGRTTDGLVAALGEQLSAQIERGSTTLRLALAETRLAATSAALLLGIAVAGAALAIVIWLLLVALSGYALWLLGLGPGAALGVLLLLHLLAAAALALLGRRLAHDLGFTRTRGALSGARATAAEHDARAVSAVAAAPESVPRARR